MIANWKSTAMGSLVLVIAASSAVHFDTSGHLAMTAKDWFTVGIGCLGQGLGLLQKDAGTVVATTPDDPTPHIEKAHELPDDKSATVVK